MIYIPETKFPSRLGYKFDLNTSLRDESRVYINYEQDTQASIPHCFISTARFEKFWPNMQNIVT